MIIPAATTIPPVPKSLKKDGRGLWKQVWGVASGWLSLDADGPAVLTLCESWDQRRALQHGIDRQGLFVQKGDEVVVNPAVNHLRKINAELIRLMGSLGLTPTDRTRMGLVEVRRVSALQNFLEDVNDGD